MDVGKITTATMTPPTSNRVYYFVVKAYNSSGMSAPSGEVAAWVGTVWSTPTLMTTADFDGDGKADPMVYRGNTGQWFASKSTGGLLSDVVGRAGVRGRAGSGRFRRRW